MLCFASPPWLSSPRTARRSAAAFVAIGLLIGISGCGGDDEGRRPPDEPPARPEAPGDEPAPAEEAEGARSSLRFDDLATVFPESVGPYRAAGPTEWNHAAVNGITIPSARRSYTEGQRELNVAILDTEAAPILAQGLLAARMLESDSLDELVRAEAVGNQPALLTWTRAQAESRVQVLLPSGVLVQVAVWPADTRDQALTLLAAIDLHALGRRQ